MTPSKSNEIARELTEKVIKSFQQQGGVNKFVVRHADKALTQARREGMEALLQKVEALDPLYAPGRWEDGSYEEIAEDIHRYIVKSVRTQIQTEGGLSDNAV